MNADPKKLLEQYGPKQIGKQPLATTFQMSMVRYSPDGSRLAGAGFDGQIHLWDTSATPMTEMPPIPGHNGWIQGIAFHPDGQRLYSIDTWGALRCVRYADKDAKPLWLVSHAHDGWIRGLALSPDGQTLATCGRDGLVRLWSADKGEKLKEFPGHHQDVFAVAFHPDGKALVSGDLKGIIKHWDLGTGKAIRDFESRDMFLYDRIQEVGGVRVLRFDMAGGTLVAGGCKPKTGGFVQGKPILTWFDWANGKKKAEQDLGSDNDGFVYDIHLHSAGFAMVVTSGQPGQGKLLFASPDLTLPFFTAAMPNCHSLAVHPQGGRLIVSATNAGSSGNGRNLGKNMEYPANYSPLHTWDMPK